jgi:uncharacterized membrane protein
MAAEILVLRFVHILSAIAWLGSGIFAAFFLIPAIAGTPVMPQVMDALQKRRLFVVIPTMGLLTVLSGLRLLWIDSVGFDGSYFSTATGRTFAIGGLLAILAFLVQVFVSRPAGAKLGALAAALSQSPSPEERQRMNAQIDSLRRRNAAATHAAVGFGLLAATAMAIARYL